MELILDQKISTRLSLAISLVDDFTWRGEVLCEVEVSIPSLSLVAIENPRGYYNFLDIVSGPNMLQITSEYYLDENLAIIFPVYSTRNPLRFPHISGTSLTKMILSSTRGAVIGTSTPSEGDTSIYLTDITDSISVGDVFMIEEPDSSAIEFCQIKSPLPIDPATTPFGLTLPIRFEHLAGISLRKMLPASAMIAKIDGGVLAGDLTLSLTNITGAIKMTEVFKIEDVDPVKQEFCQIVAPLMSITLKPNHLYPFPPGTTLIRGGVRDSEGGPVSGATIEVVGGSINTRTSANGEYVLYFPASQGDALIQINVTPDGSPLKAVNGEVRNGKVTPLFIMYP